MYLIMSVCLCDYVPQRRGGGGGGYKPITTLCLKFDFKTVSLIKSWFAVFQRVSLNLSSFEILTNFARKITLTKNFEKIWKLDDSEGQILNFSLIFLRKAWKHIQSKFLNSKSLLIRILKWLQLLNASLDFDLLSSIQSNFPEHEN